MADSNSLFAEAQALHRAGHRAPAREFCREVLQASPGHGGALHLLGQIAFQNRDMDEAAHWFSQAATAALSRGDADMALQCAVYAVTVQETAQTRSLFAAVAGTMRFSLGDRTVGALMLRAITQEWGPLAPLVRAAASLVDPAALTDDPLLRAMLTAAPLADAALETALTAARRELLMTGGDAAFAAALAQQCFLGGYIFWQDEEETAQIAKLSAKLGKTDAEWSTLACYMPLHAVKGVEKLIAATEAMTALRRQQCDEPAEERRIAAALPALTPVGPARDSQTPWPRWSGAPQAQTPVTLRDHLQQRFAQADCARVPEHPALLAAGCGTAEYPLHLAATLALDGVTAIDIDRTVLAYAARKARDAKLDIRFGQGDILQAATLGEKFGLIECGGVLHQLPDPFAGWRALLAALAPHGVMRIAVHSAGAQGPFAPVRAMIAAQGFARTPDGIRAARHWLKTQQDESLKPLLDAPIFFTDGGCRHLLFGGEHPLALPDIAAFLAEHRLVLIGLDVPAEAAAAYRARFPDDLTVCDLDNWALFEQENPQTFAAMIQFWVQRRG